MKLYQVVFGRITKHKFMVAAETADKAVDVALKRLRSDEPTYDYTREDLLGVTVAMESLVLVDTPLA